MKNRAKQGKKILRINSIAKGWIILPFAFADPVVLLPLTVDFTIKNGNISTISILIKNINLLLTGRIFQRKPVLLYPNLKKQGITPYVIHISITMIGSYDDFKAQYKITFLRL
ncbi:hypothetical protein [Dysgonomonas termitidis]